MISTYNKNHYNDNEKLINYFLSKKQEIQEKIGEQELVFQKKWGRKNAQIYVMNNNGNFDEENLTWGVEYMIKFYEVFKSLLDDFLR